MSCTKRFLGLQWEHHRWRKRVTTAEVVRVEELDMWARPVERDYTRCDKAEICEDCGTVRHEVSCICDMERGDACRLRREWEAESSQVSAR